MITSEKLYLSNRESKEAEALQMADAFIAEQGLSKKEEIHLRLLVEETLGMFRAMTGDYRSLFWIENEGDEFRLVLAAKTEMDPDKRSSLLSVSKTGKNAAVKGVMAKIGSVFENALMDFNYAIKLTQEYGGGVMDYGYLGLSMPAEMVSMAETQYVWSLQKYRAEVKGASGDEEEGREAWDEMEKSIVANLASDVIVGIKKDQVDMTVIWNKGGKNA